VAQTLHLVEPDGEIPVGAETELTRMKLYILRHGDAVEHGDTRYKETERPLTPKGVQRTKLLAHALRQMEISFDVVLSSPLQRARQTAELIARGLKQQEKQLELTDHLAPSGSMEELVHELNAIRPLPQSVLLVGHEPYLGGFISLLCTGGPGLSLVLKKGALCRLELDLPSCSKCAALDWLLQPRLLGFKPPKRKSED
jgi:phosphohistidine phosphatase